MTTSSDPDGTGPNDDVPYLPPARPVAPVGTRATDSTSELTDSTSTGSARPSASEPAPSVPAPTLPSPASSAPTVPVPAVSEPASSGPTLPAPTLPVPAKRAPAVVGTGEPVGGEHDRNPNGAGLPAAVDDSAEATRLLRVESRRRRRRNARLGWIVSVFLFAIAAVTGWFVYRAFEGDTGDPAPDRASGSDSANGTGTQGSTSAGEAPGGLGRAVDDAREIVAMPGSPGQTASVREDESTAEEAMDTAGPDTLPPGQVGPPPRIANRPEFRTVVYDIRVYEGVGAAAPYRHLGVTYDTVADDYFGVVDDSGETEVLSFSGEWRYTVGSDGVHRRVRRSASSLRPEPDSPFAALLAESDVLPSSARPFARLVSEESTGDVGIDGTATTVYGYLLDANAFGAADPEGSTGWWAMWATAGHIDGDLIVPGTEQVQLREVTPFEAPQEPDRLALPTIDVSPSVGQTGIVFRVTDRGVVDLAVLISADDEVRIEYVATEYHDEPAALTFSDGAWVDAP